MNFENVDKVTTNEELILIEKYSKMLCPNITKEKILGVSVIVPNDERRGRRACHVETVTVTLEGEAKLELFVKHLVTRNSPELDKRMADVMKIEGQFLMEFAQEMKSFCQNSGLDNSIQDLFPRAYYCDEEIIAMENLMGRGYHTVPNHFSHDFHHAKLVMEGLAKFHATTALMIERQGNNEKFLEEHLNFENPFFKPKLMKFFSNAFEDAFNTSLKIVEKSGEKEKNEKFKFLCNYAGKLEKTITDVINRESLLVSVCHANLCTNNIMFSSLPAHHDRVIFVDFQTCRTGSPNTDIAYYFFRSIKRQVRPRWKELLHIYFTAFQSHVTSLGQQIPFNFEDFVKDFVRKSEMGFLFGVFLAPGIDPGKRNDEDTAGEIIDLVNTYQSFFQ